MRFWLKFVDLFAFALPTLLLTLRLSYPDARPRTLALWLIAPFVLLAAGVVVELLVVPKDRVDVAAHGPQLRYCTTMISMMAAPILAALIIAMRQGRRSIRPGPAPRGTAAAGLGAFIYASHCPGDSPLFVATWYPFATAICMGVGAWRGGGFSPGERLLLDQSGRGSLQLIDAEFAAKNLAVDDEGRGAGDLDFVVASLADRDYGVGHLLILQALHRLVMAEAGRAHRRDQRLERLVDERPFVLLAEQQFDGGVSLVVAKAAGEQEGRDIERVAREFAENESNLAGVDVVLLQLGKISRAKVAQCGQVREPYSTTGTPDALPIVSSGSGTWLENTSPYPTVRSGRLRRRGESAARGERRGGKDSGDGKPRSETKAKSKLLKAREHSEWRQMRIKACERQAAAPRRFNEQ